MEPKADILNFEGESTFRHHIVCSLLSRRPVRIVGIGATREKPGLQDFEVNFLKFIDKCTSGSKFEVRDGQTELVFTPGIILGGSFAHAVPNSRSVCYAIEAALLLLPFAKHASEITFTGVTQSELDLSPDTIRTVTVRWLRLFGVESSLRIVRRGAAPNGQGCVVLTCANVRKLRSANATDRGRIKRVRGIAFSSNVSADLTKQCATSCKGVFLNFLPDIYVVTDNFASPPGQPTTGTNGYGMMLVAESTANTCLLSQEMTATPGQAPDELGRACAELLLDEIASGGCVDRHHQLFVLLLMAIAPDDASTVRFGPMTDSGVTAMTLVETFFGISCAIKEEPVATLDDASCVIVSCIGCNLVNVAKKSG